MIHLFMGKTRFSAKNTNLEGIGGGRKEEKFEIEDKGPGSWVVGKRGDESYNLVVDWIFNMCLLMGQLSTYKVLKG